MTDAIEAHRELSELSAAFAKHLRSQPFVPGPLENNRGMPPAFHTLNLLVDQPVPLIVGTPFMSRLEDASVRAGKLLVELPLRLARHAPEEAARYWSMGSAKQAVEVLSDPEDYLNEFYRLDILYGEQGFKVLEVNVGPSASGFYAQEWLPFYLSNPVTAAFIEAHNISLYCKNTVQIFLTHVVQRCLKNESVRRSGRAVLAVLVEPPYVEYTKHCLSESFSKTAATHGLEGHLVCIPNDDALVFGKNSVSYEGMDVHGILRGDNCGVTRKVYEACLAGHLFSYDGPTSYFSGDKRNFAVLTAQRDDRLFTDEEMATISELIPWTSMMLPGLANFEGRRMDLRKLALDRREYFVLKPARGYGGAGVHVGCHTEPGVWEAAVDAALGDSQWLLQEYATSKPYVFHHPITGFSDHDMVWGSFVVAGQGAGGTVRMKPRDLTDGVINVGRQGQEGLFCVHD